jgi:hypothetical protein
MNFRMDVSLLEPVSCAHFVWRSEEEESIFYEADTELFGRIFSLLRFSGRILSLLIKIL